MPDKNSIPSTEKHPAGWKKVFHQLNTDEIIFIILIVLSLIGVGITDISPKDSSWYWFAMVLIFGGTCMVTEWSRAQEKGYSWTSLFLTQVLHWGSLFVSVQIVFLLLDTGRLDNENTGLIILLMLGLVTFLAGIHIGWRFCLVGIFLGFAVLASAFLEQLKFMWVMLLIGIVLIIFTFFWARHTANHPNQ
jgi:hypothetical protein